LKRQKRRYLALQLDMAEVPSEKEFMDVIWGALTQIYGEYGASLANLALINFDVDQKLAVVRVNLTVANNFRAAIATITSIAGKDVAVHVLAVSGTIKALSKQL
jgi:RNase P/RNase MRP subunit POP5